MGRGLDDMGLGRGLDALIDTSGEVKTEGSSNLNEIAISQIEPNPNQPRREFDEEALNELATSIREIGIIQPVTVRQVAENKYQLACLTAGRTDQDSCLHRVGGRPERDGDGAGGEHPA